MNETNKYTTIGFIEANLGDGRYNVQQMFAKDEILTEYAKIKRELPKAKKLIDDTNTAISQRVSEICDMRDVLEALIATRASASRADVIEAARKAANKATEDKNNAEQKVEEQTMEVDRLKKEAEQLQTQFDEWEKSHNSEEEENPVEQELQEKKEEIEKAEKALDLAQQELDYYTKISETKQSEYEELLHLKDEEKFNESVKRVSGFISDVELDLKDLRNALKMYKARHTALTARKNYIFDNWPGRLLRNVLSIDNIANYKDFSVVELIEVPGYSQSTAGRIEQQHQKIATLQNSLAEYASSIEKLYEQIIPLKNSADQLTGELWSVQSAISFWKRWNDEDKLGTAQAREEKLKESLNNFKEKIEELEKKKKEWERLQKEAGEEINDAILTVQDLRNEDKFFIYSTGRETEGNVVQSEWLESPEQSVLIDFTVLASTPNGLMHKPTSLSPAATFFNYAILPGWQKYYPTYRFGTITSVYEEDEGYKCDVSLEGRFSECQNLDINLKTELTGCIFLDGVLEPYFYVLENTIGIENSPITNQAVWDKNFKDNYTRKRCIVAFDKQDWNSTVTVIWIEKFSAKREGLALFIDYDWTAGTYGFKFDVYNVKIDTGGQSTKEFVHSFIIKHEVIEQRGFDGSITYSCPSPIKIIYAYQDEGDIILSNVPLALFYEWQMTRSVLFFDEPFVSKELQVRTLRKGENPWNIYFSNCPLVDKNGQLVVCSFYRLTYYLDRGPSVPFFSTIYTYNRIPGMFNACWTLSEYWSSTGKRDPYYEQYFSGWAVFCTNKKEEEEVVKEVVKKETLEEQFCFRVFGSAITGCVRDSAALGYNSAVKEEKTTQKPPIVLKRQIKKVMLITKGFLNTSAKVADSEIDRLEDVRHSLNTAIKEEYDAQKNVEAKEAEIEKLQGQVENLQAIFEEWNGKRDSFIETNPGEDNPFIPNPYETFLEERKNSLDLAKDSLKTLQKTHTSCVENLEIQKAKYDKVEEEVGRLLNKILSPLQKSFTLTLLRDKKVKEEEEEIKFDDRFIDKKLLKEGPPTLQLGWGLVEPAETEEEEPAEPVFELDKKIEDREVYAYTLAAAVEAGSTAVQNYGLSTFVDIESVVGGGGIGSLNIHQQTPVWGMGKGQVTPKEEEELEETPEEYPKFILDKSGKGDSIVYGYIKSANLKIEAGVFDNLIITSMLTVERQDVLLETQSLIFVTKQIQTPDKGKVSARCVSLLTRLHESSVGGRGLVYSRTMPAKLSLFDNLKIRAYGNVAIVAMSKMIASRLLQVGDMTYTADTVFLGKIDSEEVPLKIFSRVQFTSELVLGFLITRLLTEFPLGIISLRVCLVGKQATRIILKSQSLVWNPRQKRTVTTNCIAMPFAQSGLAGDSEINGTGYGLVGKNDTVKVTSINLTSSNPRRPIENLIIHGNSSHRLAKSPRFLLQGEASRCQGAVTNKLITRGSKQQYKLPSLVNAHGRLRFTGSPCLVVSLVVQTVTNAVFANLNISGVAAVGDEVFRSLIFSVISTEVVEQSFKLVAVLTTLPEEVLANLFVTHVSTEAKKLEDIFTLCRVNREILPVSSYHVRSQLLVLKDKSVGSFVGARAMNAGVTVPLPKLIRCTVKCRIEQVPKFFSARADVLMPIAPIFKAKSLVQSLVERKNLVVPEGLVCKTLSRCSLEETTLFQTSYSYVRQVRSQKLELILVNRLLSLRNNRKGNLGKIFACAQKAGKTEMEVNGFGYAGKNMRLAIFNNLNLTAKAGNAATPMGQMTITKVGTSSQAIENFFISSIFCGSYPINFEGRLVAGTSVQTKVTGIKTLVSGVAEIDDIDSNFLRSKFWIQNEHIIPVYRYAITYNSSFLNIYPAVKSYSAGPLRLSNSLTHFCLLKNEHGSNPVGLRAGATLPGNDYCPWWGLEGGSGGMHGVYANGTATDRSLFEELLYENEGTFIMGLKIYSIPMP